MAFASDATSATISQLSLSTLAESLVPVTIESSQLHQFLLAISKQVEAYRQDNAALRGEMVELRIGQRLDTLEHAVQSLADMQQPTSFGIGSSSSFSMAPQAAAPASRGGPTSYAESLAGPLQDAASMASELSTLQDRISLMERKSEALWHEQGESAQMRAAVDRLKVDMGSLNIRILEVHNANNSTDSRVGRAEEHGSEQDAQLQQLQMKIEQIQREADKAAKERVGAVTETDSKVQQIADHVRKVESMLSKRMAQAELGQASALHGMDEAKEGAASMNKRLDDLRRISGVLESRLDNLYTQLTDTVAPLHTGLHAAQVGLEEVKACKLETAAALTIIEVNTAVSRAIDHADRRTETMIKIIAGFEDRVEALTDSKADKNDVVMSTDLEALLTAHATEMDRHFNKLVDELKHTVASKADADEVVVVNNNMGARISCLETAILKGLKGVSEKVAVALADKLNLSQFDDFKGQVRSALHDIEDRLRDWSPAARGMKESQGGPGSTCLCCDGKVRSAGELKAMGFSSHGRPFVPEKLPTPENLLPSISKSPDVSAASNAKVASRKKDIKAHLMTRSAGAANAAELCAYPSEPQVDPMEAAVARACIFTPNPKYGVYPNLTTPPGHASGLTVQGYDSSIISSAKIPPVPSSLEASRVSIMHSESRSGVILKRGSNAGVLGDGRAATGTEPSHRSRGSPQEVASRKDKRPSETGITPWGQGAMPSTISLPHSQSRVSSSHSSRPNSSQPLPTLTAEASIGANITPRGSASGPTEPTDPPPAAVAAHIGESAEGSDPEKPAK